MNTYADNPKETTWEQRIWTVTQLMMVAVMLWVGSTVLRLSDSVARIETRLEYSVSRLATLEAAATTNITDRYRMKDAQQDWDRQAVRDKAQDERINALATTIQELRRAR